MKLDLKAGDQDRDIIVEALKTSLQVNAMASSFFDKKGKKAVTKNGHDSVSTARAFGRFIRTLDKIDSASAMNAVKSAAEIPGTNNALRDELDGVIRDWELDSGFSKDGLSGLRVWVSFKRRETQHFPKR